MNILKVERDPAGVRTWDSYEHLDDTYNTACVSVERFSGSLDGAEVNSVRSADAEDEVTSAG